MASAAQLAARKKFAQMVKSKKGGKFKNQTDVKAKVHKSAAKVAKSVKKGVVKNSTKPRLAVAMTKKQAPVQKPVTKQDVLNRMQQKAQNA